MKLLPRVTFCLSLILALFWMGSAAAQVREDGRGNALALGDSVVFGFITQAGHAYVNASNFVAYPDYVAGLLHLEGANAGCPGEATSGFLSATSADNGCRPFRAAFPLHVAYTSTQPAYTPGYHRYRRERPVLVAASLRHKPQSGAIRSTTRIRLPPNLRCC